MLERPERHARARSAARRAAGCARPRPRSSTASALTTETPDAVQAARGLVGLAAELAARVQRGHDDLERALVRELGVRVDRDAAAVVAHGDRGCRPPARARSGWRGRPPPRPWRCRAPRRRDGAAPARRCRRHTCPGRRRTGSRPSSTSMSCGGVVGGRAGRARARPGKGRAWAPICLGRGREDKRVPVHMR